MNLVIRPPSLADKNKWLKLWHGYLSFYQTQPDKSVTDLLWQRIHTQDNPVHCFVAQQHGEQALLGMVHFLSRVDTWRKRPVCYLQDLYVCKTARGQNVGRSLIEQVVNTAKQNQWEQVYWQTKQDNHQARHLYDKLTGGWDGFINYRIELQK